MVVAQEGAVGTVGDYKADGERLVPHDGRETVYSGGLHFEVGEAASIPRERCESLVEVGNGGFDAQAASLRGVEAWCGCGDGVVHAIGHFSEKLLTSIGGVG